MARHKRKTRTHRPFGGGILRVRGREGLFGQYRINEKRYQTRLMQEDGKTPIADDDMEGAEDALGTWIVALKKKAHAPDEQGIRHATLTEFVGDDEKKDDDGYFKLAKSRVGEQHMKDIRSRLTRAAKHFGKLEMHRIDKKAAESYFVKLGREEGRLEKVPLLNKDGTPQIDEKGKPKTETVAHPMTTGTLRNHRVALSTCWAAAVDRGFATTNPWRQVRVAKGQEFDARLVTHDEVRRIVDHVRPDVRPMIEFLSETGLRLSEARALTWLQVDQGFGKFVVAHSKSGRSRTVPCSARAKEILSALWETHVARTDGPDYVFEHHDRHFFWKHFNDACDAAGVKGRVRVHDLRHYVGTSLAQAGTPIPTIMGILGHTQIQTTQRYAAHLPSGAAAQAFAALDAARTVKPPVSKTGQ